MIRNMKKSIACLVLLALLAPVAYSETVKIPADKPFASITVPDGWKATVNGDTINIKSEEDDVVIDVIVTRPDMLGPSNDKAFAMLKVKPEFDSYKDTKSTLNGMNVVTVNVDCKDSSGSTMKLTLTSLEVTKDRGVMLIQRGKGMEANKDDISAIINSVAAEK